MAIDLSRLFLFRGLQRVAGLGLSTSLALAFGCDSAQQVPGAEVPQSKLGGSIKGSFLVSGVEPVAVSPGDLAKVEGFGLTEDAQVLVGDRPVAIVERQSDRTLTFKMPEGNPGMEVVTIRKGAEQSTHLIIRLASDGEPVLIGGNLKQFCRGERFFTLSGDAVEGERDCLKEAVVCSQEAQTGCLASDDFPVVDRETLAIPRRP